ncbi:hypothetical protein ABFS83_05G129900 [Erythranthe nasuta]
MEKKVDETLLERKTSWDGQQLVKYDGFWFSEMFFRQILSAQNHFVAKDSDVILSTVPKSGTTWLKALAFAVANRGIHPNTDQNPLLMSNPHTLVHSIEINLFHRENPNLEYLASSTSSTSSRMLSTHMPFEILPDSIRESACKIIYVCRNPLDQFTSLRHFLIENRIKKDVVPLGLDESFDMFCDGIHGFGPFWDHILGYWNAHLKNPGKVLFLKYEDLKEDIGFNIKKIAEFLECPFSLEEEKRGVVEEISRLCSFENLKNVEVNKNGYVMDGLLKNSSFFRKGEVGDWTNYLNHEMAERMKKLMRSKFEGSGLMFKT